MKLSMWAYARFFAVLLTLPIPSISANAEGSPAVEHRLDALAAFFLPEKVLSSLITQSCRVAYRTKRTTTPADVALEREIPGITEQMVAATGDYCDAQVPIIVREQRDRIKADWRVSADSPELIRFISMFQVDADRADAQKVVVREGEMAADAAARLDQVSETEERAFQAKQAAFARAPGGRTFLSRVGVYQRKVQAELESGGWVIPLIKAAMTRGAQAANRYATAKGMTEPYPGK